MSDYILSATLELKDKLTSKLSDSKKALEGVKASASGVSGALDTVQASMDKTGQSAAKATSGAEKLKSSLQGVKGNYSATLSVKDMASSGLSKVKSGLQSVKGKTAAASVHLRDEASAGITHIKEGLASLTGKTYTAMVNVKQNTGGITGLTEKAGNAVSGVASGMLMNTSMQMAGAAGIGFGIYDAIKSYADFEKEMSAVKAISGATGAEFDMLTEKARQMGADTKFSATESAQAFEYMAMAGWKTDDMMNGIEGVMNLAAASGEDLGRVSDIVTDALTAFGLKASDSAHFADVLAAAATSSNTNVGMMGDTFKYVAPLAGALKYDVEDVATAIGVMANSGVKGTEAGTSLRSIFTRLAKPPKDAAKALDALGISIKNSDGTIKPFMQTMEEMRDKFSGLTDDQKVQYAASIAGQEAMSGLLAIMNASEGDFEKVANAIDHANGSAEKMAKTRMDNLAGDIELVGGAWDQFVQTIMKGGTASGLRSIVQEIGSIMDLLNDRIKDGLDFGDVFAVAGKGITDLKNKFLEFDGVGSILAGGALAAGLYKIISLTKKASSAIGDLMSKRKGGAGSATGAASATRDMVVNAANVVVNGKSIAGGGAATSRPGGTVIFGPDGKPISSDKYTPAPTRSWKNLAKETAAGGAVAAILAGLDIYTTKQESQEKLAEAAYGLESATDNLEQLQQSGASEEQISSAQQRVAEAKQYQADTQSNADLAMDESVASGIGSVIGAGIGAVLMGPMGAAVGGFLGSEIGDKLGNAFHNIASASAEEYQKMVQPESKMDDYDAAGMGEELEMQIQLTAPDDDTVAQAVQDTEDKIATVSLTDLDDNAGVGLWQSLFGGAQAAGDEAQAAVSAADDAISEDVAETSSEVTSYADEAGDGIVTAYSGAETGTEAAWSPTAGWFSGFVFGPTALGAGECGSSMTQYFSASASSSQAAWSGVGGFFSGLFASIKSEAASCAASVAASMASAAESARAGGHTTIAAGLDAVGNTAAWLGGVDYPHSASGTSFAPGGWTEINEHGGEIVDLPTGARVYPHATTMRMLDDLFSGDSYRPTMSATPLSIEVTPSAPSSNPPATINITGNSFLVREEADIDKIAYKLMQLMQQANANMNYVGEGAFV